jgi:hypothetical protein
VHLVRGERVHEVVHPRERVGRVLAVREARRQLLERRERFAGRARIPLGRVLVRELREHALVFVEVDDALQVVGVVNARMVGVQLDEAVARRDGRRRIVVAIVRVSDLELRLLRIAAEGVARLEALEVLHRPRIVAIRHRLLRLGVQALGGPRRGLVFVRAEVERAAAGEEHGEDKRYTTKRDAEHGGSRAKGRGGL